MSNPSGVNSKVSTNRKSSQIPQVELDKQVSPPVGAVSYNAAPNDIEVIRGAGNRIIRISKYTSRDILGKAGERLEERALVYLDIATGLWRNQRIDISPPALNNPRGIVTNPGGIDPMGTGLIAREGVVYGYEGIVPGAPVYAAATPGGWTQTKPTLTLNGPQVAIALMGYGVDNGGISIETGPIIYQRRVGNLASLGTVDIRHHADPNSFTRRMSAHIPSNVTALAQSYPAANYDADIYLRGPSGAGGTTTVNNNGTALAAIGGLLGPLVNQRVAQSFQVTAGRLSQITVNFGANVSVLGGTTLSWSVQSDNAGNPSGAVLAAGTFTPLNPSTQNIITFANGPILQAATSYWLVLQSSQQLLGAYYQVQYNAAAGYASGALKTDTAVLGVFGNNWTTSLGANADLRMTVTTAPLLLADRVAQSLQVQAAVTISNLKLYLSKVGAPTGTLTLELYANSGSTPGSLIANGTATSVSAATLNTSPTLIDFVFPTPPALAANTTYWLVLSTTDAASFTNYVAVGADQSASSYSFGLVQRFASNTWTAYVPTSDLIFELYSVVTIVSQWYTMSTFANTVVTLPETIGAVVGDGSGNNVETMTTFKNRTGFTIADMVIQVIVEPS